MNGSASVTTTAAELISASRVPCNVLLINAGAYNAFVGDPAVSTTNGVLIPPGRSMKWSRARGAIWAVSEGSTTTIKTIFLDRGQDIQPPLVSPSDLLVFRLSAYGAVGDGTTDDRASIQAALDAAESFGGGIVMGSPGKTYRVVPVLVSGSGGNAYRAIAMPSNVTLDLQGSKLLAVSQVSGDGCIVSPKGTESVAYDFGGASNWCFRNAVIAATSGTSSTTGNFFAIHRCRDVLVENVRTGSASGYHFIEVNDAKNVIFRNFRIDHDATTGYPDIQLDAGGNPSSPRSNFAHTAICENILFENCAIYNLAAVEHSRRVEIGHTAGTYRKITFRGGYYAGYSGTGSSDRAIVDVNSSVSGVIVEHLTFDGVTFYHNACNDAASACINTADTSNTTIRDLLITRCYFTGSYRAAVKIGSMSATTITAGNYAGRRGIKVIGNFFLPLQAAVNAGTGGLTRVICLQGCEDCLVEGNYELSPATESNVTSNRYTSIALLQNKKAICRNNTIIRQQAAIGDMASADNNVIYVTIDNALAISGTQEVFLEISGNSWNGVHRIGLYESCSPGSWAAGAYTRVKGWRGNNHAQTMGTFGSHVIVLPLGLWPAPAGTVLTGAAATDNTTEGLYAADNRLISGMSAGLAKHVATSLYATNLPNSAGNRVVLHPRMTL